MSGRFSFRVGLGLFLAAAVAAGIAAAGVRVKLEDVPKPAVKAVQDRFPKATVRSVDKEANGTYEFAMKEGERLFDVGVTAKGKLLNVKEVLAEDKVPRAVKEGLQKKYKGAKIVETEKVTVLDGKKEKVTYELKIRADDKTVEVVLDEAGKVVGE
jgi:Putative beta-lactamase-inhibitor-like, PepSY-like